MFNPCVISIGGFDPCGGAGVAADIKTCEHIGVYGLSVCTAITSQNHWELKSVEWVSKSTVESQIKGLGKNYHIQAVKIGFIENLSLLEWVVYYFRNHYPDAFIVWDPILYSSSGFDVHNKWEMSKITALIGQLNLITPNRSEWEKLLEHEPALLNHAAAVLITSWRNNGEIVEDMLIRNRHKHLYKHPVIPMGEKHGSGCVLSTSIASYMCLRYSLEESCRRGIAETQEYLKSSESKWGTHKTRANPDMVGMEYAGN